jgi:hypothetical protein
LISVLFSVSVTLLCHPLDCADTCKAINDSCPIPGLLEGVANAAGRFATNVIIGFGDIAMEGYCQGMPKRDGMDSRWIGFFSSVRVFVCLSWFVIFRVFISRPLGP